MPGSSNNLIGHTWLTECQRCQTNAQLEQRRKSRDGKLQNQRVHLVAASKIWAANTSEDIHDVQQCKLCARMPRDYRLYLYRFVDVVCERCKCLMSKCRFDKREADKIHGEIRKFRLGPASECAR